MSGAALRCLPPPSAARGAQHPRRTRQGSASREPTATANKPLNYYIGNDKGVGCGTATAEWTRPGRSGLRRRWRRGSPILGARSDNSRSRTTPPRQGNPDRGVHFWPTSPATLAETYRGRPVRHGATREAWPRAHTLCTRGMGERASTPGYPGRNTARPPLHHHMTSLWEKHNAETNDLHRVLEHPD
jgi:hypothetical protein